MKMMKMEETLENSSEKKQLLVRLTAEEKKNFYIKCLKNNKTMQEVLSDYISSYIRD